MKVTKNAKAEKKQGKRTTGKGGRSISAAVVVLANEGKDSNEIWAVIQKEFGLPDSKKPYASWYRWNAERKGLLRASVCRGSGKKKAAKVAKPAAKTAKKHPKKVKAAPEPEVEELEEETDAEDAS